MSEFDRIKLLAALFGPAPSGVRVGIGDDAAVVEAPSESLVWTVDAQVDGTHFRTDWVCWEDVGWRSFMAAASDLAAMGAEPVGVLSALVLAPSVDDEVLAEIARGQAAAAKRTGLPVIGGNLARGGETSITTTVLGRARTPVLRTGARPGDRLYVSGALGLAAAGLRALVDGRVPRLVDGKVQSTSAVDPRLEPALEAWRRPLARLEAGRVVAEAASRGVAHAAIDVSDGLAGDAAHLAEASGVTIVIDSDALVAHGGAALAGAADALGASALELALGGGEDYALLVTASAPLDGFTAIGEIVRREDGALLATRALGGSKSPTPETSMPRVLSRSASGIAIVDARGFDHFG